MADVAVERVSDQPQKVLADLVEESAAQGWDALRRLVADWVSGARRFDSPGEGVFVALRDGRVVGVCVLEADPFSPDKTAGRLRDVYVSATHRRAGIGKTLVKQVVAEAAKSFEVLALRADTAGAAAVFTAVGFEPVIAAPHSTHRLDLRSPRTGGHSA
jgi:GNAT superfamily N-acetyltransferase